MNRVINIIYVFFCFEVGIFLFLLPWFAWWQHNYFVEHYAWLAALARNYCVRGAVSGLGLADIWLAFYEVMRLRRQAALRRAQQAR